MSYTPTFTTNNGVGCISTSGDQKVGISDGGVTIDYNLNSIPHKHFTLTPAGVSWNDGSTSYTTGLERLTAVQLAFSSIELPPNSTTLKVNDTVLVDNGTTSTQYKNDKIKYTDATTYQIYGDDVNFGGSISLYGDSANPGTSTAGINAEIISLTGSTLNTPNTTNIGGIVGLTLSGSDFRIDGNGNRVLIVTPSSEFYAGDPFGSNTGTSLGLIESSRWILLNSVDVTTNCGAGGNNYTIPVNFTTTWARNYAYNTAGSWEMVRSTTISLPNEYFTLSNQPQLWKIEVAFNCYNMTDQSNKDYAMYLELRDDNGSTYQGFAFNQNTPFTTHRNASTYSATSSQIENYCWTDHFDLSGFVNGNIEIQIWRYANANMSTDFNAVITFSKTNLV